MATFAVDGLAGLQEALEAHRDPAKAIAMAAYMRGKFPFLGIATPKRRRLTAAAFAGLPPPGEGELGELLGHLWERPEREYQYAGCDLAARHVARCGAGFLDTTRTLITTKSWWDTVDALASSVAGPLVARYPAGHAVMDEWIASDNLWLARSAILHQLRCKQRTDAGRLFRYCELRLPDEDFFIRKAIGWALRDYSKTDGEAVRAFVAAHPGLSPLSRREALLWLEGGRKGRVAGRQS